MKTVKELGITDDVLETTSQSILPHLPNAAEATFAKAILRAYLLGKRDLAEEATSRLGEVIYDIREEGKVL